MEKQVWNRYGTGMEKQVWNRYGAGMEKQVRRFYEQVRKGDGKGIDRVREGYGLRGTEEVRRRYGIGMSLKYGEGMEAGA